MEIQNIAVCSWELKSNLQDGQKYVVYRIEMNTHSGQGWSVFRRYSDFVSFDLHIRQILPNFNTSLPPKEVIRPFVSLVGLQSNEPSKEFIESRRYGLDQYLKDILRIAGGSKKSVWNHPNVLTFLDIPFFIGSSDNVVDINCPVSALEWNIALENAKELFQDLKNTLRKINFSSLSIDSVTFRHFNRQLRETRKSVDKLQNSLDYFARVDVKKISDDEMIQMSSRFQELAGEFEEFCLSVSSLSQSHETIMEDPISVTTLNSPPIARTPNRNSRIDFNQRTPKSVDSLSLTIQEQDARLSKLSSIIQRQKVLGDAISRELDEQNVILDNLETSTNQAQSKVNTANRLVKKL